MATLLRQNSEDSTSSGCGTDGCQYREVNAQVLFWLLLVVQGVCVMLSVAYSSLVTSARSRMVCAPSGK